MSNSDDERRLKMHIHAVYSAMHDGLNFEDAKRQFPFPALSTNDRTFVCAEAERHITEVKAYLRRDANQWFFWGGGILVITLVIVLNIGASEAGRNIGRMWFGMVGGIGLICFGIYKKIKPL